MIRGFKDYAILLFKGCAMGAADVVPGVSGGTIAFISGIYEELLCSIKSFDLEAIKLLFSFKLKDLWKKVNGSFLLAVGGGVALAVLSLAKLMTHLLENYPIIIWSFFFGLIIASSLLVFKEIKKFNITSAISILIGIVIAYFITILTPAATPNDWWFIILSGAIAICAMILPGISGSFILLLLGKYFYIMDAISTFNMSVIALFALGAGIGIISFSHLLTWLLNKFHTVTVSILTGFMLGSLNKVWPWKNDPESDTSANISPVSYESITGEESQLVLAIIMCVVGFLTIYLIELIGTKLKSKKL